MSLNWNVERCKDYKKLTATDEARALTHRLVWETMTVDIGHIKDEETVRKFVQRSKMYGRCCEFQDTNEPLTVEQVMPYIGMYTNVITLSDAAYKKKLWAMLERNTR